MWTNPRRTYRLREIYYSKGILKTKEYNKGAVLGKDFVTGGDNAGVAHYFIDNPEIDDADLAADGERFSFVDDDGIESQLVM